MTALFESDEPRFERSDLELGRFDAQGPLLVLAGSWTPVFDVLGGERRIESGSLRVAGASAENLAGAGRLGLMRAEATLPANWTSVEVLRESARLLGQPKRLAAEHAAQVAAALGLSELLGKKLTALGPGQLRALGIAAAALGEPVALALEEPFAGLEPSEQAFVAAVLRRVLESHPLLVSVAELTGSAERDDFIATAAEILLLGRHALAARGRHSELLGRAATYRVNLLSPAAALLSHLMAAGYEARAVPGNETALMFVDTKDEGTHPLFAAAVAVGCPIVELSPLVPPGAERR